MISMHFIKSLYILCELSLVFGEGFQDGKNLTDLQSCKLSHVGVEYRGKVKKTESGTLCQSWDSTNPVHKIDDSYTDDKFSDLSKKSARNYCRNPSKHPDGPWCYTLDKNNINETCPVPLCAFHLCRATGPGIEYAGKHNRGFSGRKCLKWNKSRKMRLKNGTAIVIEKYKANKFPENDLVDSKNYCRNPSGDIGGPWCFVSAEESNNIERDYCDVAFCEEQDCTLFTKDSPVYSHYSVMDSKLTNFTFGLRLWDSDSFLNASAKLSLTVLPLPITGKEMETLGVGIEIFLSTTKVALTYGNKDKVYFESLDTFLVSHKYEFFSLTWDRGIISLSKEGAIKPIFMSDIKTRNNLLGFYKDSFYYYSAVGDNIQWSFPFCDDDDVCDVHVTTAESFQQFWPLEKTDLGFDLKFYVRAFHSGYLLLVPSPAVKSPSVKIMLDRSDGFTEIIFYSDENSEGTSLIKHQFNEFLLDYWKWSEFTLTIFADNIQIYNKREFGTLLILDVRNDIFKQIRWFSPASKENAAYWTFFCEPPKSVSAPPALLPECSFEEGDVKYEGTQDVTSEGDICLPWSGKGVPIEGLFINKTDALKTRNFCRNPKGRDPLGAFCYVYSKDRKIVKKYCNVRKCKSNECKLAGTGNDYVGQLSVSRSNRSCVLWSDVFPKSQVNESWFADKKIEDARNYCRNPTRNLAGSWCPTDDKNLQFDLCNVRDCDKNEECTVIVRKKGRAPDIHILPRWKERGTHGGIHFSLKQWNPDQLIGVVFEFKSFDKDQSMKLVIGEEENEKVQMYYNSYLVKESTLSHLVHSGKWASFWLQIRKGEVALGYEDVETALFEWVHDNAEFAFEPTFFTYMSLFLSPVGFFFDCDECHVENITNNDLLKVFPLSIRRKEKLIAYKDISFRLRGNGTFNLLLSDMPDYNLYHVIELTSTEIKISKIDFLKFDKVSLLKAEKVTNSPFLKTNTWKTLNVSFDEKTLNVVSSDGILLMNYTSDVEPLVFFWFSVGSTNGWVAWTVNCDPMDIDGPPLDGGWSEWSRWECTVTCGGGEGFKTRTCTNPPPNIYGQVCHGSPKLTGTCNAFPCGDLSPERIESVQDNLRMINISLKVQQGRSIIIDNNNKIINYIKKESPDGVLKWTLNGLSVKEDNNHVILTNNSLLIKKANNEDVGVYAYVMRRINKKKLVIFIASLAVYSDNFDIVARASFKISLKSNAVTLAHIFNDLSQKWLLNGTIYFDYGITMLQAVAEQDIDPVNESHWGEWECVVEQVELRLKWVTNIVKVQVKKKPNIFDYLMENKVIGYLFRNYQSERSFKIALVASFVIFFFVVILCTLFFHFLTRMKKTVKNDKKKKRKSRRRNRRRNNT